MVELPENKPFDSLNLVVCLAFQIDVSYSFPGYYYQNAAMIRYAHWYLQSNSAHFLYILLRLKPRTAAILIMC